MRKHLHFAVLMLLAIVGFTACDDEEVNYDNGPVVGEKGAYVVLQGNQYAGITGEVDALNFSDASVSSNVFRSINQMALGDSPQTPVRHGAKVYIPTFGSNRVWITDATTLQKKAYVEVSAPQAVCGAEGYVFAASNDGYVVRMDTLTFSGLSPRLEVGPNPAGMTYSNGKLYVTVSDGYNSAGGYANGKKVVVIDPETFTIEKEIAVGLNPGQIVSDLGGNVFVVCMGNYGDIAPKVQKISPDGTVTDFCSGSLIAANPKGVTLYVIDAQTDWVANTTTVAAKAYYTLEGKVIDFAIADADLPAMPTAININPTTGNLFICSDPSAAGYSEKGYVNEYSTGGRLLHRYNVGVHPYGVVFF